MARMRVNEGAMVSCMVFYREDGHELSLSSDGNSLIEWKGSECIKDYGRIYNTDEYLAIAADFLAAEKDEPANVYSRHPHRDS